MNNENKQLCSKCGGKCCKKMPRGAFPTDFGTTIVQVQQVVHAALATGQWSIDWYDGDPTNGEAGVYRGPFVRPAIVQGRGQLGDPSWGGICCLLQLDVGCTLSFDERPTVCRMLTPMANNACTCSIDKRDLALAWQKYWPWLEELLDEEAIG